MRLRFGFLCGAVSHNTDEDKCVSGYFIKKT